ncbi:MAG: hypothetical protein AB7U85_00850 [Alphaproteobacteria bacterium]
MKKITLILLFFLITSSAKASTCDELVDIFRGDYLSVELADVVDLMEACLVEASDNDYSDNKDSDENFFKYKKLKTTFKSCKNKSPRKFAIEGNINFPAIKIRENTFTDDLDVLSGIRKRGATKLYDAKPKDLHTMGLFKTDVSFELEPEISTEYLRLSPNSFDFCQYISHIEYQVNVINRTVYLSQDIKSQTCDYYFTLRHELIHAANQLQVILDYLPFIEEKIRNALYSNNFYYDVLTMSNQNDVEKNVSSFSERIKKDIADKIINGVLKEAYKEIFAELGAIDEDFDYNEFLHHDERKAIFCGRYYHNLN